MLHLPQRPFIPHRTPNKPRSTPGVSEFHVSRPFVPGVGGAEALTVSGEPPLISTEAVMRPPGIEQFLKVEPPPVAPRISESAEELSERLEEPDDLPPLEHFLDPLPPVTQFATDEFPNEASGANEQIASEHRADVEAEWEETDWQNFDWRSAAALGGESGESEASNAWAATDWEAGSPGAKPTRPTAAQAIANALDQIADRIRAGEIVPTPGGTADPASIAATLASILGIRQ